MDRATKRLTLDLSLKAVDTAGRIIEGYAAVFGNLDRNGDILAPGAFDRTLREQPDVAVFIGHDIHALPVGEPVEVRPDAKGLYTKTFVYNTAEGDALLEVARRRMASGKTLGMSIGYRTRKDRLEQREDGTIVRHLEDVDLLEYSFLASPALAANPEAVVLGVKQRSDVDLDDYKAITDADKAALRREIRELNMVDLVASHRRLHQMAAQGNTLTGFTREDMEWFHAQLEAELRRRAKEEGREPPEPSPLEWGSKAAADTGGSAAEDEKHFPDRVRRIIERSRNQRQESKKSGASLELEDMGVRLLDLSAEVQDMHHAMVTLGIDTKGNARLTDPVRAKVRAVMDGLAALLAAAEQAEGDDGAPPPGGQVTGVELAAALLDLDVALARVKLEV